jgi:threonylcarbamoyladenosine tRNA methylthiotransferase MtaB
MPIAAFGNRTRALLKIQDGCNLFRSYCIVPFTQGVSRSMPPSEMISALTRLDHQGYKEIALAGIHLGMCGHDLTPATDISQILGQICNR